MQEGNTHLIELKVDDEVVEVAVQPHHLLVDVLRDGCGRTSVKECCESAGCGACTVLIDGQPTLSCITLALDVVGRNIQTAENSDAQSGLLRQLQDAFVEHHATQCGFCTPGMLNVAVALLNANPHPTEQEVRAAIAGNLCRCTGYVRIVRAILAASRAGATVADRRIAEFAR